MILTRLYNEFFRSEKTGGLILVLVTVVSIGLANSLWQDEYMRIWQFNMAGHSITHWINDGLMTIFFLLIGLELEREILKGELSDIRNAMLPIFGAIGGMLLPAVFYLLFNYSSQALAGIGIPTATDIAFAIGILSLLGKQVPGSLKIFLTALAVIDDLGAIMIIAVFYTGSIAFANLLIALGIFGFLILMNRLKVYNLIPYLFGGAAMWYFMLHSGIHPTITGVLLAFAIPFRKVGEKSPSYLLQHFLHKPVAFFVLPLFAVANTSIIIGNTWFSGLGETASLGILAGLVIGKPLGIVAFAFMGVAFGLCRLPLDLKWKNIIGAGFLAGIGFTMSIFITLLAFEDEVLISNSKFAIIVASTLAGIIGFTMLKFTLGKQAEENK
ncbi:MAG: Na+/H+ antiporter NhaA [Bacteroidales bacterium]|nr:Na+/H+ antiporter NhaA [Bacteroidales bacterium]